MIPSFYLLPKS